MKHASLSPSSAAMWTSCTAAPGAQVGQIDSSGVASREGTCCHQLSSEVLEHLADPQSYLGREMWFVGRDDFWGPTEVTPEHIVIVTQPMIDACVVYTTFVCEQVALTGGELLVEQRVPIGQFTGEADAYGTSDAVILTKDRIIVTDAKFGRRKVDAHTADGRGNLQLICYALGAMHKFEPFFDFTHVTLQIVQPFIGHVSEFTMTVAEIRAEEQFLRDKADETRNAPVFAPSQSSCMWCKAKATCKAREYAALAIALEGFEDVDTATVRVVTENQLGSVYEKLGMLTDFCKDIAKRVYENLTNGTPVKGFKLVAGKRGDRKFTDPTAVEALLSGIPADLTHETKLLTPAKLEKVVPVEQWAQVKAHITQADGSPSIAHESDPRPALLTFEDN